MHYSRKRLLILLVLIHTACSSNNGNKTVLPFDKIKVLILSKYKLHSFSVQLDEAQLFLSDNTFSIKKQKVSIRKADNKLIIEFLNKKFIQQYVSIFSSKNFKLVFYTNNKKQERFYKGDLNISIKDNSLEIVNNTPVEDYIASAARAELGILLHRDNKKIFSEDKNTQLIKAMETAIRSYIFYFKERHSSKNYQFCDLTHCLYFPGIITDSKTLTSGYVMITDSGQIIPAYFHSTCGGSLSGPESYWPAHKYFSNFKRGPDKIHWWHDDLCKKSPHYKWQAFVTGPDLNKIIGERVSHIDLILNSDFNIYSVFKFNQGRRVKYLEYKNDYNKRKKISFARFYSKAGRVLGWHIIKSNFFKLEKRTGGWLFTGKGLGHGVGMCQWGAYELSRQGASWREILKHYYNNAKIVKGYYEN